MKFLELGWWKEIAGILGVGGLLAAGAKQIFAWWKRPDVQVECSRCFSGVLLRLRFFNPDVPTAVKSLRFIYCGIIYEPRLTRSHQIAPLVPPADPNEELLFHLDIPSSTTLNRWAFFTGLPEPLPDPFSFTLIAEFRNRRRIRRHYCLPLPGVAG